MTQYQRHFASRGPTPLTQQIPGRPDQVQNNAGGFVFAVDKWARLHRWLMLGAEGGTYYVSEQKLVVDNAKAVLECIKEDGPRVVREIVEISDAGRAPKNDPALFALALAASADDMQTRQAALAALSKVARIPTHLYHFVSYVQSQRGWGRALKRAVAKWYNETPVDRLALHAVKYQQRDGWSHRDLLRLSHPAATSEDATRHALYAWMCGRTSETGLPAIVAAFEVLKQTPTAENAVGMINEFGLPREAIPTELLNNVSVWDALLYDMPLHAMVRNLGKMSAVGLLKPLSDASKHVIESLTNAEAIRKSRLHPFALLLALKIYESGHGDKGSLTWTPVAQIVDALDDAFYLAFQNVVPTGKSIFIGVDVSGSMSSPFMNSPLRVCEAAAAMAMTVARTEKNYVVCGFADGLREIKITAKSHMRDVLKQTMNVNFGGTDCALPILEATKHDLAVDAFLTITDNETWVGNIHPTQALKKYREKTSTQAKSIVCGMTSSGFTIADPTDAGQLDVVGFDTATPAVIADFIRS